MSVVDVKQALSGSVAANSQVTVRGWVRTRRDSKAGLSFVNVSDGSCFDPIQVVAPARCRTTPNEIARLDSRLRGDRYRHAGRKSQGKGQSVRDPGDEGATSSAGSRIPRPTRSSPKRTRWSICARSRTCARARTRSAPSRACATAWRKAIHRYFHEQGFFWINTPIITASDAEGAGQMFRVSTLDLANLPRTAERAGSTSRRTSSARRPS